MYERFEVFPTLSSGVSESLAPVFAGNACVPPNAKKGKPTAKLVMKLKRTYVLRKDRVKVEHAKD
jgi:hypothetical protein